MKSLWPLVRYARPHWRGLVLVAVTMALTVGLDVVRTALDCLVAGRTTFIIAHRLSTIRSADLIVVLEQGQIVEQGGHQELLEAGGLYAMMYRQQMNLTRHDLSDLRTSEAD